MDVNKDDKTSGTHSPFAGYYSNTVPAHDPLLTETGAGRVHAPFLASHLLVVGTDGHPQVRKASGRRTGRLPGQEWPGRRPSRPLLPSRRFPRIRPDPGKGDHVQLPRLEVRH